MYKAEYKKARTFKEEEQVEAWSAFKVLMELAKHRGDCD